MPLKAEAAKIKARIAKSKTTITKNAIRVKKLEKKRKELDKLLGKLDDNTRDEYRFIDEDKELLKRLPHIVPSKGAFTCYKRGGAYYNTDENVLITLYVPAKAKRVTPDGLIKSRVSEAVVKEIRVIESGRRIMSARSNIQDCSFKYEVGLPVKPDRFDPSKNDGCTHGIHVFMQKNKARSY